MKINRVLISVDESDYLDYLPVVSLAWQKLLGIKPTLALVTEKSSLLNIDKYCQDVLYYDIDSRIPSGRCKTFVARMLMRYKFNDEVCMVSDIDLIPLSKHIFEQAMGLFKEDCFMSIGSNLFEFGDGDPMSKIVDPNLRKFPSCYTIAKSNVWKDLINPLGLNDYDLVSTWLNINEYDHKESANKENFCDESLIRLMIQKWNPARDRIIGIPRPLKGFTLLDRIDKGKWRLDQNNLFNGKYVDAHCPRPLKKYVTDIILIAKYLDIYKELNLYER